MALFVSVHSTALTNWSQAKCEILLFSFREQQMRLQCISTSSGFGFHIFNHCERFCAYALSLDSVGFVRDVSRLWPRRWIFGLSSQLVRGLVSIRTKQHAHMNFSISSKRYANVHRFQIFSSDSASSSSFQRLGKAYLCQTMRTHRQWD